MSFCSATVCQNFDMIGIVHAVQVTCQFDRRRTTDLAIDLHIYFGVLRAFKIQLPTNGSQPCFETISSSLVLDFLPAYVK